MTGNPKTSPWYAYPRSSRKRRGVELALSAEARLRLVALVEETGMNQSRLVEAMILKPAAAAVRERVREALHDYEYFTPDERSGVTEESEEGAGDRREGNRFGVRRLEPWRGEGEGRR